MMENVHLNKIVLQNIIIMEKTHVCLVKLKIVINVRM